MKISKLITLVFIFTLSTNAIVMAENNKVKKKGFSEVNYPTPNVDPDRVNEVQGVILHHTDEPTAELALQVLTYGKKGQKNRHVGTHVVIDTDGTRYIMCRPDQITYHAGASLLNGREHCNDWCLGIEFQGNTCKKPLTEEQINSAIEWLLPLIKKYNIPIENIVTHETIRNNYKRAHPGSKAYGKVDITQKEYERFMNALKSRL